MGPKLEINDTVLGVPKETFSLNSGAESSLRAWVVDYRNF